MRIIDRKTRIKSAQEARRWSGASRANRRLIDVMKKMEPGDCLQIKNPTLSEHVVRFTARYLGTRIKWRSSRDHGHVKGGKYNMFWLLYEVIPDDEIGGIVRPRQDKAGLSVKDWDPPAGWEVTRSRFYDLAQLKQENARMLSELSQRPHLGSEACDDSSNS